jgi:YesN/AraC family two-component response regulator
MCDFQFLCGDSIMNYCSSHFLTPYSLEKLAQRIMIRHEYLAGLFEGNTSFVSGMKEI